MKSPSPPMQRLLLSTTLLLALISHGSSFQPASYRPLHRRLTTRSSSASSSITRVRMSSSFQQARLAEQLRLSRQQPQAQSDDAVAGGRSNPREQPTVATGSSVDNNDVPSSASDASADEARDILALENEALGPDGMPFAPMMTYQKYLTMQEKRVKVTIRYSAEAGLRPFYLTVANQIKGTHPDVLMEKRILPPVGSDAGGAEATFEVLVDGKLVIGKKKTKMLKVSSRASSTGDDGKDDDHDKNESGSNAKQGSGEKNAPDIAGGRSIFVSMEKLDHELTKARKRRRPNTMYKSKEDALRGVTGEVSGMAAGQMGNMDDERVQVESNAAGMVQSTGLTDAVIRLEKLKAMSNRKNITM